AHDPRAMTQREVELILVRQLASYLALPIFIVDPDANRLYYNEPAEILLGLRFEETGEMPVEEWGTVFVPRDIDGVPLPPRALPLVRALQHERPEHGRMVIDGLDGVPRVLDVTALPLVGQHGRALGAMAVFWEV
ncbi:MAG TPA: PAS domain-containing protein, partial [Acidimicrobiales bacterium]|nr:PAS domain-containing protein [Acidimicrobiales bacterium]